MIRTVALMIKVQRTVADGSESFMAAPKAKPAADFSGAGCQRGHASLDEFGDPPRNFTPARIASV
jgi:hypothetical protein